MDYKLNKIYEGFREQMKDRRSQTFSQKMNQDMYNSIIPIQFKCKELGEYLAEKGNKGKPVTAKDAEYMFSYGHGHFDEMDMPLAEFEEEYKKLYTFNEFKYFKYYPEDTFYNVYNMTEVTIPDSIKVLPNNFLTGRNIKKINFENTGFDAKLKKISYYAIVNTSIKEIIIPNSVSSMETEAFNDNWDLEKVRMPGTMKNFNKLIFKNCHKMKEMDLPASFKKIEYEAFETLVQIQKVVLHSKIKLVKNLWQRAGCKCPELWIPKEYEDFYKKPANGAFEFAEKIIYF